MDWCSSRVVQVCLGGGEFVHIKLRRDKGKSVLLGKLYGMSERDELKAF